MPDVVEDTSGMPQNKESETTGKKAIENIDLILRDTQDVIDRIEDSDLRNNLRNSYKNIGINCDLISEKLATSELRKLDLEAAIESNRN